MKNLSFAILILLSSATCAQTVLIKEVVPEDFSKIDGDYGPNRKKYTYPYFGYGTHSSLVNLNNDTLLQSGANSFFVEFGTRRKHKLNNLLNIGTEFQTDFQQYGLSVKSSVPELPYALAGITKAKHSSFNVGTALYLQLNFKPKRGNQLGTYLDLGGYARANFLRKISYTYNSPNSTTMTTAINNPDLMSRYEYGGLVRFGRNIFAINAKYRVSQLLIETVQGYTYDLPRFSLGIQFFPGNV